MDKKVSFFPSASAGSSSSSRMTTHVTFVCQKCSQPIKLHKSLQAKALVTIAKGVQENLRHEWSGDEEDLEKDDEMSGSVVGEVGDELGPISRERSSPTVAKKGLSGRKSSIETLSVIYGSLTNPTARQDRRNTMKQIQIASEAFDMISAHSDVDHPMCVECPDLILGMYDEEIAEMEKAKEEYDMMCHSLQHDVKSYEVEKSKLDEELVELTAMEKELTARLKKIEEQRAKVDAKKQEKLKKEACLKEEEKEYWKNFNQYQQRMLESKDEQVSLQYQLHYTTEQLSKLKKTNILNKTFHIWHNGHFGTINGLRLGRLRTVPVEWVEINAAWGQTVFLLSTLARFTNVEFEKYRVVPYGNQSYIEPLEGKRRILPLYSGAGLRVFTDAKFDNAMVAFLDCLNQLKKHIETTSHPHFALPYSIDKDKIGDVDKDFYSVKTQFNTEERWTKALKFLLTNLRWALTWVAANRIHNSSE